MIESNRNAYHPGTVCDNRAYTRWGSRRPQCACTSPRRMVYRTPNRDRTANSRRSYRTLHQWQCQMTHSTVERRLGRRRRSWSVMLKVVRVMVGVVTIVVAGLTRCSWETLSDLPVICATLTVSALLYHNQDSTAATFQSLFAWHSLAKSRDINRD